MEAPDAGTGGKIADFAPQDAKFADMNAKFADMNAKFADMNAEMADPTLKMAAPPADNVGNLLALEVFLMSTDYIPGRETEFHTWLVNFQNVAGDNMAALGLTAADLTALSNVTTGFSEALEDVPAAKAAYDSAIAAKDTARKSATADVRGLVRRIQANPAVTPALKSSLGITVPAKPGGKVTPVTPAGLVVNGLDTGTNTLQWKPNGNKKDTAYVIQAQVGDSPSWSPVDVVTATRYDHTGQTPGVRAQYRIIARRRTETSGPSNTGVVYG